MNKILFLVFISFLSLSCNEEIKLQEGDILFQDLDCGDLCEAIETVTQGVNGRNFSHCGMVVRVNDSLKVIEAIGNKVQVNSIDTFLARSGDSESLKNTVVGRLKPNYSTLIYEATSYAVKRIGEPYDNEFILNNGSWYCSELVYDAFKQANNNKDFFELSPMTYKDPKTGAFFPAWINYYEDLQKPIPEGQLGLNPGSISRSNHIEIIDIKHIPWQQ